MTDEEQLAQATTLGAALVSHNRADFEQLAAEWFAQQRPHAGIILANRRPVRELAARLAALLHRVPTPSLSEQVFYT